MRLARGMRWLAGGIVAAALAFAAPAPAQTHATSQLFAILCATSIGFHAIDPGECGASVFDELGIHIADSRKEPLGLETIVANALAGNVFAGRVLGSGVSLPLVPLNADPCDALRSVGGGGCSSEPAAAGSGVLGASALYLNEVLTDEQEALLGCGPYWGTDCERDGIDLARLESSVLLQSFPGIPGETILLPGARGPGDPGYDPTVDGCTAPTSDPACGGANGLVLPTAGSDVFASEMAALSWNFLLTLIAMSQPLPGEPLGDEHFDPDDPLGENGPRCSFATPQYCSSVQAFFGLPEPGALGSALAAAGALALVARRARRS